MTKAFWNPGRRAAFALAALAFTLLAPLQAQAAALEDFFGSYEGTVTLEGGNAEGEEVIRSTHVDIVGEEEGFRVDWSTAITKTNGKIKEVSYSIHFQKTETPGTFSSAMRKNMFGRWVPLNPLKGDPYVWARQVTDTLSVYALIIREDGGYEMQQYDRKLLPNGNLDLTFTRVKDGMPLKTISGVLARR